MQLQNRGLKKLLDKWPGKKTLGIYRFLPMFFVLGAALEFSMINWTVGETNFCEFPVHPCRTTHLLITHTFLDRTFKKRQAEQLADEILRQKQQQV